MDRTISVLWLTPYKPKNISVGRERISEHLEEKNIKVTLRGTNFQTIKKSLGDCDAYDAVIGTTRAGALGATLLKLICQKPLIIDHVDPIRQLKENRSRLIAYPVQLLETSSFIAADHIIYVYEGEKRRVSRYSSSTSKTELGVNFEQFANPDPKVTSKVRKRLNELGVGEKIVIYIGGLEPIYHIEELLAAMEKLPEWTLLVLGEGSLRKIVKEAASEKENIVYLGTVPHEMVPGYLHESDVGLSLVDDPHTLKALEYSAAGLSVVQISGRSEKKFGERFTYCEPSPISIAKSVKKAAKSSSKKPQRFAKQFRWDNIANTYERAIRTSI